MRTICDGPLASVPLLLFPRTFLCVQKVAAPEAEAVMGGFDHRWKLTGGWATEDSSVRSERGSEGEGEGKE